MKRPAARVQVKKKSIIARKSKAVKRPASQTQATRSKVKRATESTDDAEEWSYERLFDATRDGWHKRNVKFWKAQTANLRGATGGGVSKDDLAFSKRVISSLVKSRGGNRFGRVLDCGAGIGRVTDTILRTCCRHVDLLEFEKKHLDRARQILPATGKSGCTFGFHCKSAQAFSVKPASYDFVWCQWLLMYLTDVDAVAFLTKTRQGIAKGGVLLVKENVSTSDKATYFDDADGELWLDGCSAGGPISCVRTPIHYEDLFLRAGLIVAKEWKQSGAQRGIMDMVIWSLVPITSATGF